MNKTVTILIAEDDKGHQSLIKRNLKRAGISNPMIFFDDGQLILDHLMSPGNIKDGDSYLLILDISMPKISGVEVLDFVKNDMKLKRIPTIMLTTTDDPREINNCHELGCNNYITKPIEYEDFINKIMNLGLFLTITENPSINNRKIGEIK
ncbi:MAG: response regulator [Caldisericia bacterium]